MWRAALQQRAQLSRPRLLLLLQPEVLHGAAGTLIRESPHPKCVIHNPYMYVHVHGKCKHILWWKEVCIFCMCKCVCTILSCWHMYMYMYFCKRAPYPCQRFPIMNLDEVRSCICMCISAKEHHISLTELYNAPLMMCDDMSASVCVHVYSVSICKFIRITNTYALHPRESAMHTYAHTYNICAHVYVASNIYASHKFLSLCTSPPPPICVPSTLSPRAFSTAKGYAHVIPRVAQGEWVTLNVKCASKSHAHPVYIFLLHMNSL